jgi:hypothetical protein
MQPFGLNEEPAEKQNAQNYDYGDNDDLNQTHSRFLDWLRASSETSKQPNSKTALANCQRASWHSTG